MTKDSTNRKRDKMSEKPKIPVDKFGRELKVGDFLAYGHSSCSSAYVRIGKVIKITLKKHAWGETSFWQVQVIGVDDTWNGPRLCSSKGTLSYPDRTLILPREAVSAEYLAMLDPITAETKLGKAS
jgi:hypothetical protein